MSAQLSAADYVRNDQNRVWSKVGYRGIPYNDGDEPEERIAKIIEQANDLSCLSTELARQCTDWPSRYHLAPARANILRPFAATLRGSVLEIGAGCGAITRFLGEQGGQVLAVEGSLRRAAIAASRTRDLDNVTVIAENFAQFDYPAQFDVITLIGVLEYANLFMHTEHPPLAMLQRVRSMLKPQGILILAIENQLGLKYFAGAGEDHTGLPMYGIEGRYRPDQPQTFGRAVLTDLLRHGGFSALDFLLPLPDYKLPSSIITSSGLNCKGFDAVAFARQSACYDPQLPPYRNFAPELTWPVIFENGLALDLANSFLVAASPAAKPCLDPQYLAFHYSTGRQAKYCKETIFRSADMGALKIDYRRLSRDELPPQETASALPLQFVCPESADYLPGATLLREFVQIITTDGWQVAQVAAFVRRYLGVLQTFSREIGGELDLSSPHSPVNGVLFDALFQNIIVRPNGKTELIDREWVHTKPIELGCLLFRTISLNLFRISRLGVNNQGRTFTPATFYTAILDAVGLLVTMEDLRRYVTFESELQTFVTGYDVYSEGLLSGWLVQPLKTQTVQGLAVAREQELVANAAVREQALAAYAAVHAQELAGVRARLRTLEGELAAWHRSLFGRLASVAHNGRDLVCRLLYSLTRRKRE